MYKELAIASEEVECELDKYLDSVKTGRPLFVKQGDKYVVAINIELMKQLVNDVSFKVTVDREVDGSFILLVEGYDVIATRRTLEEATQAVINDLREYVQDYFNEVEIWSKDKQRASQLKELLFILVTVSDEELKRHFTFNER